MYYIHFYNYENFNATNECIGLALYVTCMGHMHVAIFLHYTEVQLHENGIISYVKLICNLPF